MARALAAAPPPTAALRVLLALGEATARSRLAVGLGREGLRVCEAAGAAEALARIAASRPHAIVVVCPLDLSATNSCEALALCRSLCARASGSDPAVLVLGSALTDAAALAAFQAGADACALESCSPAVLAQRLRALVRPALTGLSPAAPVMACPGAPFAAPRETLP